MNVSHLKSFSLKIIKPFFNFSMISPEFSTTQFSSTTTWFLRVYSLLSKIPHVVQCSAMCTTQFAVLEHTIFECVVASACTGFKV